MEIHKKCWPELFEKVLQRNKNADLRLADFNIKKGDILILEEWDPETKEYTGRTLKRTVANVNKVNLTKMHSIEEVQKFGHWVIEFE
jgi:hypothetical protein